MTRKELAAKYGVNEATIYNWKKKLSLNIKRGEYNLHCYEDKYNSYTSNVFEGEFVNSKPIEIIFNNREVVQVYSWKSCHTTICELLVRKYKELFTEAALNTKGTKRKYFSYDKSDLINPYYLDDVQIYLELNNDISYNMSIIKKLVKNMGIDEDIILVKYIKNS